MKAYYAVTNGHCFHGVGLTPLQAYQNTRQQMIANVHQVDEALKADPNCQPVTTTPEEVWKRHIFPSLRLAVIPKEAYLAFKEHQAKDRWYYTYAIDDADILDDPTMLQIAVWIWAIWHVRMEDELIPREWPDYDAVHYWTDALFACGSVMDVVEHHPEMFDSDDITDMMTMMRNMYIDAGFDKTDRPVLTPKQYERMWNRKREEFALRLPPTKEQK